MSFLDTVRGKSPSGIKPEWLTPPNRDGELWDYAMYQVSAVDLTSKVQEALDAMGAHGWELVDILNRGLGLSKNADIWVTFVFKRRK